MDNGTEAAPLDQTIAAVLSELGVPHSPCRSTLFLVQDGYCTGQRPRRLNAAAQPGQRNSSGDRGSKTTRRGISCSLFRSKVFDRDDGHLGAVEIAAAAAVVGIADV